MTRGEHSTLKKSEAAFRLTAVWLPEAAHQAVSIRRFNPLPLKERTPPPCGQHAPVHRRHSAPITGMKLGHTSIPNSTFTSVHPLFHEAPL